MLDPFRFSADRKLDRELLAWFERVLEQLQAGYDAAQEESVAALVKAPQEIRGYGPVREAAAEKVRAACEDMMGALRG